MSLILIYSSYIDSEGVWRLNREENGDKRRGILLRRRNWKWLCFQNSRNYLIVLVLFRVWFWFYFWLSEWNGKLHELVKSSIKRREDKADKKNLVKKYEQLKSEYEKKTRLIHQLQEQVDNFKMCTMKTKIISINFRISTILNWLMRMVVQYHKGMMRDMKMICRCLEVWESLSDRKIDCS